MQSDIKELLPRRMAQDWLSGARPTLTGVVAELRAIVAAAREHTDDLAAVGDSDGDPIIWVCATTEELARRWLVAGEDLPLPTHQMCAANAAAAMGARLMLLPL